MKSAPAPTPRGPLHPCLGRAPQKGFPFGYTEIAREEVSPAGIDGRMDFGIHVLRRGEAFTDLSKKESVWLLLHGAASVTFGGRTHEVSRESLFDQGPTVLHTAPGQSILFKAKTGGCKWAVIRTSNPRLKGTWFYGPEEFTSEIRGVGLVQGACRRLVRTVFDYSNRPDSNLVLGEVINQPGRWSSYPPHHHPQPEIYYYSFTPQQGYGHAELGDEVLKVREGDTVIIPGGLDHGQVSAPGYAMYYLWVVRHLPRRPYKGFTVTSDHRWVLNPDQQGWKRDGLSDPQPPPPPTAERF